MKYSIIIPYHSNRTYLVNCVDSLARTVNENVEILIVANNSNKKEIDIQFNYANCKVLKFEKELMYPKAINIGAQSAKGDFLIFCDADTYYLDNWFESLTSLYNSNEDIGYCSSKLVNPKDKRIIDFGIGFTQYNSPHPFKGQPLNYALLKEDICVQAACAASSMIDKELFLEVGMFDERLVHSYSDIDLCLRLKELGYKTYCSANSIVYHQGSSTIGSGMSDALKSDTKGIYMALNNQRIEIDMNKYYEQSAKYFNKRYSSLKNEYLCIDFTTIADKQWHYALISDCLGCLISDIYNKPFDVRDAKHIPLYYELDSNISSLKYPVMYFVDDFLSLTNNELWKDIRDTRNDIVVDRNANIALFNSIV